MAGLGTFAASEEASLTLLRCCAQDLHKEPGLSDAWEV